MATSYGPQDAQANEKPAPESSLDLILTQHLRDEKPESREVRACLEVDPPSSLVLPHFFELSHLGDFVTSRLRFW
jgi:hypothetical protein